MRRWVLVAVMACGGSGPGPRPICLCDAPPGDATSTCDVLTQSGCPALEKCTWIVDATTPYYVGHIGCALDGSAQVGAACEFGAAGATGYDSCQKGAVCSTFQHPMTTGVCEPICDQQGGSPSCDAAHACIVEPNLFSTGSSTPAAAGVCETTCDPLADNDFDGPGSALARTGSACGSATNGCYGLPSHGTSPATAFRCMPELHYATPLRHRAECNFPTGCADPDGVFYANSCNQGYLPVLRESTSVSTIVCVALCQPVDCYAGNCGINDVNRLGATPHRCMAPDAVGAFGSDEECQYLWAQELDAGGHWLRSSVSDTVGICVDHAAYGMPPCASLPLHGSGSGYDAASLGCVSSQTAGLAP